MASLTHNPAAFRLVPTVSPERGHEPTPVYTRCSPRADGFRQTHNILATKTCPTVGFTCRARDFVLIGYLCLQTSSDWPASCWNVNLLKCIILKVGSERMWVCWHQNQKTCLFTARTRFEYELVKYRVRVPFVISPTRRHIVYVAIVILLSFCVDPVNHEAPSVHIVVLESLDKIQCALYSDSEDLARKM